MYFELDLTDPYTISALTSCQLLPQGENLQDVLPRDIYRRLKRHLEYVKLMLPSWMTPDQRGKGLYADYLFNAIAGNWERKRPVWVMLMVNSLTEADIKTRGVPVLDLYLAQEAERMKKKTGAVEKVEEQCHPLNGLNFSQVSVCFEHLRCLTSFLLYEKTTLVTCICCRKETFLPDLMHKNEFCWYKSMLFGGLNYISGLNKTCFGSSVADSEI